MIRNKKKEWKVSYPIYNKLEEKKMTRKILAIPQRNPISYRWSGSIHWTMGFRIHTFFFCVWASNTNAIIPHHIISCAFNNFWATVLSVCILMCACVSTCFKKVFVHLAKKKKLTSYHCHHSDSRLIKSYSLITSTRTTGKLWIPISSYLIRCWTPIIQSNRHLCPRKIYEINPFCVCLHFHASKLLAIICGVILTW